MFVAQFANDNQVYFECHPFHYFVKDIKTGTILLVGRIHDGLYHFNLPGTQSFNTASNSSATAHTTHLESSISSSSIFDLWHKRLFHPYNKTVMTVLQKCNVISKNCKLNSGEEFRSFPKALSQLGIHHRLSYPHISKQNGLVERKHRHIVDTGLTLLSQANMPMHLWAHAFISVVYIINRLPTSVLTGRSPYEVLHKTVPSYMHLKVFGCRIFVSKHVVFDEACFLFANSAGLSDGSVTSCTPRFQHQQSQVPILVSFVDQPRFGSPNLTVTSAQQILGAVLGSTTPPFGLLSLESTEFRLRPNDSLSPGNETCRSHSAHPSTPSSVALGFFLKLTCQLSSYAPGPKVAFLSPSKEWTLAAHQEYDALLKNNTCDLVPLPANQRAVGCKWVFKLKRRSDGTISHYKGRLVVKGYLQEAGIDFQDTFSPVLRQVDINNAFLNGDLSEEIYMVQPFGFEQNHGDRSLVCRLKEALYGLKQALRAWFSKLRDFLLSSHFVLANSDGSLFFWKTEGVLFYVLVYVDDIIITGNHQDSIDSFVSTLDTQFSLEDLEPLSYFLGIEVTSTTDGLFLS
ncbi:Retrovirus-related Pol polyprotein from transposon TNT 1-94 [Gossypium australe]|uniref:Retrovirus-related Pol polyprotein from transposon TNT 1-94 n=1 Tax=Gossypium australe TaxID=47621 RepID=A0A5B6WP23_9ROSI|nr:Retrovirus-related Pol polyprotein from transposon TNT 1-94 [Gossypium australe]